MSKRASIATFLTLAAVAATFELTGCNGDDSVTPVAPDASLDGSSRGMVDGGSGDALSGDATNGDGGAPDSAQTDAGDDAGTTIVVGSGLPITMTNAGHVLCVAEATAMIEVTGPGMTPVPFPAGSNVNAVALGDAFFNSSSYCPTPPYVGELHYWSKATGVRVLTSKAPNECSRPMGAASSDGSTIAFVDAVDPAHQHFVLQNADGSGSKTLVDNAQCSPVYEFLTNGDVLAEFCEPGADGGTAPLTIARFAAPTYARTDLATNVQALPAPQSWTGSLADPTHTWVWAASAAPPYDGALVKIADGTRVPVDQDVGAAMFDAKGQLLVYQTRSGGLKRSAVASPSPTSVVSGTDVTLLLELSPDGNWAVYGSTSNVPVLVQISAAATPVPLPVSGTSPTFHPGEWFTADSKNVLFYSATTGHNGLGTLTAMAVSTGKVTSVQANVYEAWTIGGGEVVYAWRDASDVGQILAVDLTAGTAPRVIAPNASQTGAGGFAITPDRKLVAYYWSGTMFMAPTR